MKERNNFKIKKVNHIISKKFVIYAKKRLNDDDDNKKCKVTNHCKSFYREIQRCHSQYLLSKI